MPRRRKLARKRSNAINKAVSWNHGVQALEKRLMFTTFTAAAGQVGIFEYEAENGNVMRIQYSDVTFEALGVSVSPTTDATTVGDLIQAGITAPTAPILPMNLFTIYVSQSSADSYITIAQVPRQTLTPSINLRTDIPFGAGQSLYVAPADGLNLDYTVTPGANIGSGVLGAVTFGITNGPLADIAISTVPFTAALGVYPANYFGDGLLHAGFYVADDATGAPQDFNTFKFAGEVFGGVSISGSIQMFYAGAVLTGDATGIDLPTVATSASIVPNFVVGGDIHDLITSGDIGGDIGDGTTAGLPNYDTGFVGSVGGKVGEINELSGGFFGTLNVAHNPTVTGLTDATPEQEIEYQNTGVTIVGDPGGIGQIFQGDTNYLDELPNQLPPPFTNNTPETAQYLGSSQTVDVNNNIVDDQDGNIVYDSEVQGTLQNGPTRQASDGDPADWYAVSMLGGQSMTVSVTGGDQALIIAEIEDPDGRIIASDVTATANGVIEIKTDRPGIYRIGLLPDGTAAQKEDLTYLLKISGTGDQGLGVIAVGGEVSDMGLDGFLTVQNGDFGGFFAAGNFISGTAGPTANTVADAPIVASSSIVVLNGNFRTIVAASIGTKDNANNIGFGPYLDVPKGSVGLVKSTVGVVELLTQFDPNYLSLPTPIFKTDDADATAIGGSIQTIDAATTFFGDVATNAGIGTIRAADMATKGAASYFDVNADNIGSDGIIDLIDVAGDFGTINAGGPGFVTNNGGDIRYLQVGGTIYLPSAFGGVVDRATQFPIGAASTFTDDSGNSVTVTPDGPTVITTGTSTTTTTTTTGPQISILSYPVLDKAGKIPVDISSTGSLTISGSGGGGTNTNVEIGTVSITGEGRAISLAGSTNTSSGTTTTTTNDTAGVVTVTTDAYGNTLLQQPYTLGEPAGITDGINNDPTDEFLSITGSGSVDVLNTVATVTVAGNSPVEISNTTRGEMVNLTSPGVGTIFVGGNLGFATPVATAAAVLPRAVITGGNVYPFVQQHTGVVLTNTNATSVNGSAIAINVGGAVGNIISDGTIETLIANYSQSVGSKKATATLGQLDGIVAPIVADRLLYVDVGQGLLPTGSGTVGLSGLYAAGKIGVVTNKGNPNGDIRGNIVSSEVDSTNVGIDAISITNASIIGSTIATIEDVAGVPQFIETSALGGGAITVAENNTSFAPGEATYTYDIGPISVSGLGGIIGTSVITGSLASVTVSGGGFGIFTSSFTGQSTARLGGVSASGYGLRDDLIRSFSYVGTITATGNGSLIPVTQYPVDIRSSDVDQAVDPYFGLPSNADFDINAVLGTSAAFPNIPNVTDTGVVQDTIINGGDDFGGLSAAKARTSLPDVGVNVPPTPTLPNIPVLGTIFANSITFGGSVGFIRIGQVTDGLQITAGSIGQIAFSSSVNRLGLSVAGKISSLTIHGNLGEQVLDNTTGKEIPDSYINAGGPNGTIGTLRVYGNLYANITANASIQNLQIIGDLDGDITALAQNVATGLGTLRVTGSLNQGSLNISGNVGSIITSGSLNTSTGTLDIPGSIKVLQIGANRALRGSSLQAAVNIGGTLGKLTVFGQITGSVTTGVDLTNLTVTGDGTATNIITGTIDVGGRLGTAKIIGGNVASNITSSGSINSFVLTRGSVLESATIQSQIDAIKSFKITGGLAYGLFGSLLTPDGTNENIDISGNFGDGTVPATITALTGNVFRIRGSIQADTNITVSAALNYLRVDDNVLAGAVISAHPLKKQKIFGANNGNISAG